MKKLLVATWTLLAWAWAQFPPGPGLPGPMAPTMPPGPPSQGQVYQNPALGMSFPVPAGFEPAGEMPVQGGMAAAFLHLSGAELYAVSYPFQGDLQAFHRQNLQRLAQLDAQLQAQGFRVQRQPLSGLSMGGRPALGVQSQILYQGQSYVDLSVYTTEGGRVYAFQQDFTRISVSW